MDAIGHDNDNDTRITHLSGSEIDQTKSDLQASCSQDTHDHVDTVSLGMVVIDEIRLPSRPPLKDVAGGSGAYATLGSRLFHPGAQSHRVGCLVLAGKDFPEAVRQQLLACNMNLVLKTSEDRLSTRGLLEYADDAFGSKTFKYTTPPLKASPSYLINTRLLSSKSFHLLATPAEILQQIPDLRRLRAQMGIQEPPFIVWEPLPASCTAANFASFTQACTLVNVFSPNHIEVSALFGNTQPTHFSRPTLEAYATDLCKGTGARGTGIVIIRAGEYGSLTVRNGGKMVWLLPYYLRGSRGVVDPTGAGNAFLGGFMAGWNASCDVVEASMYAVVAASFAVEQVGLPRRTGDGAEEEEIWNGVSVQTRMGEYRARFEID
ncbi:hypothetical protein J1614_005096 [Plenodomus biglobosus]|nr:hypothetical protein J1614_005096 [Plenodomus biglobosus]